MQKCIFLMAGRTGGPLTPLVAVSSHIPYRPVIVGVRHGYEKTVAQKNNWQFLPLPEAKLRLLSFKRMSLHAMLDTPWQIILLAWSVCTSIYYLLKFKPAAIIGAGGFTSVPMVIACRLLKYLGQSTKIIIHQQDPVIGLTNKIAFKFCDYGSYVYNPNKEKILSGFRQIPNPISFELYERGNITKLKNTFPDLASFLERGEKPILLIFGGGSGSEIINNWVLSNHKVLLEEFKVLHLTGLLQHTKLPDIHHPDYLRYSFLLGEMPLVLLEADIVMCRAGLGSISELLYLQKPGFLVPISDSHQEDNAAVVAQYFEILREQNIEHWVETIAQKYPESFTTKDTLDRKNYKDNLLSYYKSIQSCIDNYS